MGKTKIDVWKSEPIHLFLFFLKIGMIMPLFALFLHEFISLRKFVSAAYMAFVAFLKNDIISLTDKSNAASVSNERTDNGAVRPGNLNQVIRGNPTVSNDLHIKFKTVFQSFST